MHSVCFNNIKYQVANKAFQADSVQIFCKNSHIKRAK